MPGVAGIPSRAARVGPHAEVYRVVGHRGPREALRQRANDGVRRGLDLLELLDASSLPDQSPSDSGGIQERKWELLGQEAPAAAGLAAEFFVGLEELPQQFVPVNVSNNDEVVVSVVRMPDVTSTVSGFAAMMVVLGSFAVRRRRRRLVKRGTETPAKEPSDEDGVPDDSISRNSENG